MPIYEYECDGCHAVFEVRQKVSDPAPTQHTCGSHAIRRILSATSFVLKGTGWYATDYGNRSKGEGSQAAAQTPPAAPQADAKTAKPSSASDKAPKGAASGGTQAPGASKPST